MVPHGQKLNQPHQIKQKLILYAACAVGSTFLGDVEMEQKFDALTEGKIVALNQKEIRASMKGGSFSSRFNSLSL